MASPKKKIQIFVVIIALFFSFLIYKAVESSLVYYLTVSEALAEKSSSRFKRLRVSGIVEEGSIKKNSDGSINFINEAAQTIAAVGCAPYQTAAKSIFNVDSNTANVSIASGGSREY